MKKNSKGLYGWGNDILCCGCKWIYTTSGVNGYCKPDNSDEMLNMREIKTDCKCFTREKKRDFEYYKKLRERKC